MARTRNRFEWDQANRGHVARHGVSAVEFEQGVNNDPIQVAEFEIGGEWRAKVVAVTDRGRLLEMIYTVRLGRIRAVTAYPLNRRKREFYRGEFQKQKNLG